MMTVSGYSVLLGYMGAVRASSTFLTFGHLGSIELNICMNDGSVMMAMESEKST